MQRISVNCYKDQYKKRIKTNENQASLKNQNSVIQRKRFSTLDSEQFDNRSKNSVKPGQFFRNSESHSSVNFLKNMIESNQRKRQSMLNNMILKKNNLHFKPPSRNNDKPSKLVFLKTQQKQNSVQPSSRNHTSEKFQNYFPFTERKRNPLRISHRDSQFLKKSFNQRIKEIKLKKYFQQDQVQSQKKLFQAFSFSLIGQKHKQNQDSICYSNGVYVLCDGHGSNGKQISNFVSETVHKTLNQILEEPKIDESLIVQTYKKIDLELDSVNFDVSFSGCTCVSLIRHQNTLFCISLGDSRAIVCSGYTNKQISITHKPNKPIQKERIQNYGGIVRQTETSKDRFMGPMRIWAPGKNSWGPGLALSRAFGDKASRKYGVISTPEITKIELTSDEEFIVIGSDGLFDYLSDKQICYFIQKYLREGACSKEEICEKLAFYAKKQWVEESDDITCIIIYL